MGEIVLSIVHKTSHIITQKDKQVDSINSGQRSLTAIGVCVMNAVGQCISLMLVFKSSRINDKVKRFYKLETCIDKIRPVCSMARISYGKY